MEEQNKLKPVYSTFQGYTMLSDLSKKLFDSYIYPVLLFQKKIDYSNRLIAHYSGFSESTIEKKLRELDRQGLIVREQKKFFDNDRQAWTTMRTIVLSIQIIKIINARTKIDPNTIRELIGARADAIAQQVETIEAPTPIKKEITSSADSDWTPTLRRTRGRK